MTRFIFSGVAVAAVLACGTVEASSSASRATALVTQRRVVGLAAGGAHVAVHLQWKLKSGVVCDSVLFWRPGGKVSRVAGRGCDGDGPSSYFDALTLAGTRLVWVNHFYGNFSYCYGPFTATLRALKPVRVPNGVCDRLDGGQDSSWDFAAAGHLLVAHSYEFGYCGGPPECDTRGPYQTGVTLYSFAGKRFSKIASLPAFAQLRDVDGGRILLQQDQTLQLVDTRGAPLASVQLAERPAAALLSGTDLVAAVGGSLLDYDPATSGLRATWPMAPHGRLGGLVGGRAMYVAGTQLHLLRLSDGKDRVVATVPWLALARAQLTSAGLFFAANGHGAGTVTFVPTARLPA